ncbi:MAG: thioredoxin-dependent thiol peroxidase [Terrimicrobiaceae bacterium]|nr:thioredoxin-dependent thiol peroxidase [Terrimicrobiaceae bacterium]
MREDFRESIARWREIFTHLRRNGSRGMIRAMAKDLAPGDPAPDFTATAVGGDYGTGKTVKLSDLRGQKVVLYFYPKDDTPGCTTQACALRDRYSHLREQGAVVFGISPDPAESHRKFIDKFSLPFPLISDDRKEIVQAYGVWVEKSLYGKKYMGTERSTFVIRPDGTIKSIFRKVKPAEHTEIVLNDIAHFEP